MTEPQLDITKVRPDCPSCGAPWAHIENFLKVDLDSVDSMFRFFVSDMKYIVQIRCSQTCGLIGKNFSNEEEVWKYIKSILERTAQGRKELLEFIKEFDWEEQND